jgi:N-sulfoglucosamine sulfohydrolase
MANSFIKYCIPLMAASMAFAQCQVSSEKEQADKLKSQRPNILFYITDDQSWLHTSIAGEELVHTPGFDRVAKEGVLFTHAFVPAPSCAPCRASILTGRYPWQIEEGANLFGGIPKEYTLFTHLLQDAGYYLGLTYKDYWPGNMVDEKYHSSPLGKAYNFPPQEKYPEGIADCDYTASFRKFFQERDPAVPFFFWVGIGEPHRVYKKGIGIQSGMDEQDVTVPSFFPDVQEVRSDMLDYFYEINHQDQHLVSILDMLEKSGELDNTIIIVTSDNGMPFPRAKANLYEHGTRVPLAVRWGNKIQAGRVVDDVTNLLHFAPTLLELAGIPVPEDMSGRSLTTLLSSKKEGVVEPERNFTVTGMERHSFSRRGGLGYPMRALRTQEWLLIRNFEPDRWPAGDPPPFNPIFYSEYGDVDESPTKKYIVDNKEDIRVRTFYELAFHKRPEYELYFIPDDPENLVNLAYTKRYEEVFNTHKEQLNAFLLETKDPRIFGTSTFDNMPFYWLWAEPKPIPVDQKTHPSLF